MAVRSKYGPREPKRPPDTRWWFYGLLQGSGDREVLRAYKSWLDQRNRCYNKRNESYRYYGAKGIEVRYNSREFVGWWLQQMSSHPLKKPTISRVDHDGHYEFGNIKLDEHIDNCIRDVIRRCGPAQKRIPVRIYDSRSGEALVDADSVTIAAEITGSHQTMVSRICRGKAKKTMGGFSFKYLNQT